MAHGLKECLKKKNIRRNQIKCIYVKGVIVSSDSKVKCNLHFNIRDCHVLFLVVKRARLLKMSRLNVTAQNVLERCKKSCKLI